MKFARVLAASVLVLVGAATSVSAAPLVDTKAVDTKAVDSASIGAKILVEIDRRAAAFKDREYSASMEIFADGQLKKTLEFKMLMMGLTKQFLTFNAPGDVAGMKVLMEDADTLYLYLPEFKKVRRVAAHAQKQGFLGSTFTYEDMTQAQLTPFFEAEFVGRDGAETTLKLTAKSPESTYQRVDIVIDATKGGVTVLRYFDGAGKIVRQQTRGDWKMIEGELMPTKITMMDVKTGATTVVSLTGVRVNIGLDDSMFSRRMLLRG